MPTVIGIIQIPSQTEGAKKRRDKSAINGSIIVLIIIEPLKRFVIRLPNGEYFILSLLIFILQLRLIALLIISNVCKKYNSLLQIKNIYAIITSMLNLGEAHEKIC
jgi:hypothetical protein